MEISIFKIVKWSHISNVIKGLSDFNGVRLSQEVSTFPNLVWIGFLQMDT